MMFGLFRTEPDAEKHAGISYLLVPMDAPGIDVRPLRRDDGRPRVQRGLLRRRPRAGGKRGRRAGQGLAGLEGHARARAQPDRQSQHDARGLRGPRRARAQATIRDGRPAIEDPTCASGSSRSRATCGPRETSNMRQFTAAAVGEPLKVMRPMMMNKLYSTDTMQTDHDAAYDLLAGDGLLAPADEDLEGWKRERTPTGWVAGLHLLAGAGHRRRRHQHPAEHHRRAGLWAPERSPARLLISRWRGPGAGEGHR